MRVYASEIKLGIQDRILANTVVKAECPAKPLKNPKRIAETLEAFQNSKVAASYSDLYYVDTILVSSSMNKNDDCFGSDEIWRARYTPVNKPTNIGHNMDQICGTMYRTWVLTAGKRKVIPHNKSESDLPGLIHLACSAVIWRDLPCMYQDAVSKLILAIEAGEMAVSMEAHFNEFDYALLNTSTGRVKVVARNEETAWMSGLLRWFGGEGVYTVKNSDKIEEVYRIGRYLKGITFTGKGFVTNPANPDSIILTKSFEPMSAAEVKMVAASNRVAGRINIGSLTKKEKNMSDITPKEYGEMQAKAMFAERLEAENKKLLAKIEEMEKQIKADEKAISGFEFGKKEYEALLTLAKKEKEDEEKKNKEQADVIESLKKEIAARDEELAKKKSKCEELEKELAEIKDVQVSTARQALLLKEGIESKDAEAFVKIYANFSDEQFKVVANTLIEAHNNKAVIDQLKKDGKVSADVLDKIKPEGNGTTTQANTQTQTQTEEPQSVFASLAQPSPKVKS